MCVVMETGDKPLDEIIAGIDKGIYVMRFSGGQPAPSGEFSGVAKNSFPDEFIEKNLRGEEEQA